MFKSNLHARDRCVKFWKAQLCGSILMNDQVLSWCIHIPTIRPCPHGQNDLFSHKGPGKVWVVRNLLQEISMSKHQTGTQKRLLRWTFFASVIRLALLYNNHWVFPLFGRVAMTQTASGGFNDGFVVDCRFVDSHTFWDKSHKG